MHIILYLYAQISSLSLPGVSFLEKGRTTLHKGHQKLMHRVPCIAFSCIINCWDDGLHNRNDLIFYLYRLYSKTWFLFYYDTLNDKN